MVMEKDGEDRLDRSCGKSKSITNRKWTKEYPTRKKKKQD